MLSLTNLSKAFKYTLAVGVIFVPVSIFANDEAVYTVDMGDLDIGDVPQDTFGDVVVVKGACTKTRKAFKGFNDHGTLNIELPALSKNFEITFNGCGFHAAKSSKLVLHGGDNPFWIFQSNYARIQSPDKKVYKYRDVNRETLVKYKIVSKNNALKFLVNDEFIFTQLHDPASKYDKLSIVLATRSMEIGNIKFIQK